MSRPHIVTVVGARPQFVKAAVVSKALKAAGVEETLIHSGQHYDVNISQVFFEELGLQPPALNLEVGSGSHAVQTGAVMEKLESALAELPDPDWLLVYGDTNTTLAAAIVAAKVGIPLGHVEAGLRSFNRHMPEEINRIVTDRLSKALFCPTRSSVVQLETEGIREGVHFVGDVMFEATCLFGEVARSKQSIDDFIPFDLDSYALATLHRPANVDDSNRLHSWFTSFGQLPMPVVLPLHPRTRSRLKGIAVPDSVHLLDPVGYFAMLRLVHDADVVLTDSGGLQKEAYWLEKPCVTLRSETEWIETLENGWNQLAGPETLLEAVQRRPKTKSPAGQFGRPAGDEMPSALIAKHLIS